MLYKKLNKKVDNTEINKYLKILQKFKIQKYLININ